MAELGEERVGSGASSTTTKSVSECMRRKASSGGGSAGRRPSFLSLLFALCSLLTLSRLPLSSPTIHTHTQKKKQPKPRKKIRNAGIKNKSNDGEDEDDESEDEPPLAADLSARVLREARAQQAEVEADERGLRGIDGGEGRRAATAAAAAAAAALSSDDEDEDEFGDDGGGASSDGDQQPWNDGVVEVSPEDEAALAAFAADPDGKRGTRSLADVILEKVRAVAAEDEEAEAAAAAAAAAAPATPGKARHRNDDHHHSHNDVVSQNQLLPTPPGMDERVATVYRGVGRVLSRYTAGRLPKAFKVVPSLRNWEDVLYLTDPSGWSPHATFQATRLFVSSLNARLAQRFLALVLLPAVRRDIQQNRRLHFALYQAMRKAAYKPDAFYKGLLLPLCASGDCTLREAVISASVLARASLPPLPSAAALLRLADMPFTGINSFFIRALIDKRYALPYRVVDALVDHFANFENETRQLPVVWHHSLLAFVRRYGSEVRAEDRPVLQRLVRAQYHHLVSPEIQRELSAAGPRGGVGGSKGGTVVLPGSKTGNGAVPMRSGVKTAEDPRHLPAVELMDDE